MINKLRKKLIIVTMVTTLCILLVIFFSVNLGNYYRVTTKLDTLLTLISQYDGQIPLYENNMPPTKEYPFDAETRFETRYFYVKLDTSGNITETNTENIASETESSIAEYLLEIAKNPGTRGYLAEYRYMQTAKDYGSIIIFINCAKEEQQITSVLLISGITGICVLLILLIILIIFSTRVLKPMIENFEKQKRFITDAGHELKTPIAIIVANTEVLEMYNGKSEWTDSIKNQTQRLDRLVKSLLQLAKLEEGSDKVVMCDFDLSRAVSDAVEPFRIMAEQKNKTLTEHITADLRMTGDENGIKTLMSVLTDNAIKYASDNGKIDIYAYKSGKNNKIEVKNSASEDINEAELAKLFDRFYRADSSRSRETGGFGIGLSIARSVVLSHKGKISAYKEGKHMVCFSVTLPGEKQPILQRKSKRSKKNNLSA